MASTISDLQRRLQDTERALKQANADTDDRMHELHEHKTALAVELNSKKQECVDLKQSERSLQSHVEDLESVIAQLNLHVSGLKAQINQQSISIKNHEEQLLHRAEVENNLREVIKSKEDELLQAKISADALEYEKTQILEELVQTKSALEELQQSFSIQEKDLDDAQQLNASLADRISELEAAINETDLRDTEPAATRALSAELTLVSPSLKECTTAFTQTEDHIYWNERYKEVENHVAMQEVELKQMEQVREALQVLESQKAELKDQIQSVEATVMDTRRKLDFRRHYDAELERWIQSLRNDVRAIEGGLEVFRQDTKAYGYLKEAIHEALAKLECEREQYLSMMQAISDSTSNLPPSKRQSHTTRETMVQTDEDTSILPKDFERYWPPSNGLADVDNPKILLSNVPGSCQKPVDQMTESTSTFLTEATTPKISSLHWSLVVFTAWLIGVITALMVHTAPSYCAELEVDGVSWTLAHFIRWLDVQLAGTEARLLPT